MDNNAKMELINLLKDCKSAEELQAIAQEHGCPITQEQASAAYDEKNKLMKSGADLSDEELENIAGGSVLGFFGSAIAGGFFYDLLKNLLSDSDDAEESRDGWAGASGSW